MRKIWMLLTTSLVLSTTVYPYEQFDEMDVNSFDPPTSGIGIDCKGGGEPLVGCDPAYNAPAAIDVNFKKWNHSVRTATAYVDAAFTYWYAGEEGLGIAENGVIDTATLYFPQRLKQQYQSFDYQPGFKATLGVITNHEYVLEATYIWFRGTNTTDSGTLGGNVLTANSASVLSGQEVWVVNDWFLQGTAGNQALAGSQITSRWKLSLDIADAMASRPFYQAKKLTITPSAGLRFASIRQSMNVKLTEDPTLFDADTPTQPIVSKTHSNSWGIGPKFEIESKYLLSAGFRFEGDIGASLLYTTYHVKHNEERAATTFNQGNFKAAISGYSCVRPMGEVGLGLGWGSYVNHKNFHIDFSLDYDFMLFWSQNMMRRLLDDSLTGTSPSSSDLYLHGLTVTGRFDF